MRISEIIAGERAITVDTGLHLSRYLGLNAGFWTGLQIDYVSARVKDELAKESDKIKPMRDAVCIRTEGVATLAPVARRER